MAARKAGSSRKRSRRGAVAPLEGRLYSTFTKVVPHLEELGARYSLIGGLAVGARVEPRTTRDIDFAVDVEDDTQAEALVFALSGRGYTVDSLFQRKDGRLATVRTYGASNVMVDYLFASTRIEREIVVSSTPARVFGVWVPCARLGHLLAMKVKAGRTYDAIDTTNLIRAASAADLRKAESALRLMQKRGADPERDFVAELRAFIQAIRREDAEFIPVMGARLRRFQRGLRKSRRKP